MVERGLAALIASWIALLIVAAILIAVPELSDAQPVPFLIGIAFVLLAGVIAAARGARIGRTVYDLRIRRVHGEDLRPSEIVRRELELAGKIAVIVLIAVFGALILAGIVTFFGPGAP